MTHASQYPAGTRFRAGLSFSTVLPDLDFETFSEAGCYYDPIKRTWHGPHRASKNSKGLPAIGAVNYATHPSTEILTLAYNLKDGTGSHHWRPDLPPPLALIDHIRRGGIVEAWNSAFEWWIWNYVGTRRYGWPPLAIEQTRCAMAKARAFSYPGKLEIAGEVMGLSVQKDKDGDRLIKKFSVPQNPTKANGNRLRVMAADAPEDFRKFVHYNDTDIVAEAEAASHCPDLVDEELEFWIADQKINRRGVHVDAESLRACAEMVELVLEKYDAELKSMTGGAVERASQLERLRAFVATRGLYIAPGRGTMDDDALSEILKSTQLDPLARRALEIRQLAGSASVKKVFAMVNTLSLWQRLHDLFNYHGAHTGRPTGEGPQPTNLPKAGPKLYRCLCGRHSGVHLKNCAWCGFPAAPKPKVAKWGPEAVGDVLEVIKRGRLDLVEQAFGDAFLCVSGCLRGLFTAAPGHDLVCSDFSSIESVVTAILAGEQWRIDLFRTHGKNYEMAAAKISGVPFEEMMRSRGYDVTQPEWWGQKVEGEHHPLRQTLGKVSELASGFGGWISAWLKFGAGDFMTEDEIKKAILAWRRDSPAIVHFWGGQIRDLFTRNERPELFGLEGMAIKAVLEPGVAQPVRRLDGSHSGITFTYDGKTLYCTLPSGRNLHYHNVVLSPNQRSWGGQYSMSFERYNTNPTQGAIGWVRVDTYSGKLCENVVQAVARDIQRFAMINCERQGYPIVLHVYDEIVAEVPEGFGSVEGLERIMATLPPWAVHQGLPWPIKAAGGWRGKRYRKD